MGFRFLCLQADYTIFEFLHQKLEQLDPQKFPLPDQCNDYSFQEALYNAEGPVSLILDEANVLARVPKQDLSILLQIFRALKHVPRKNRRPNQGLAGLILVGTEALPGIVMEPDHNIAPFSYVSLTPSNPSQPL